MQQHFNTLTKRIINAAAILALLFISSTTQAEEFYITKSYGNGSYATPEQIDANFKAIVQTPSGWDSVDKDAIWKNSDKLKTFIYVHGNLTDMSIALRDGNAFRRQINKVIPDGNYKLIVWFWNSDLHDKPLIRGTIDAQTRSVWESFYLARFLQSAPKNADIRLIGYCFGANTVLGACQLLSGGTVNGKTAPGTSGNIRTLLIAPAAPTWSFVYVREKSLECQTRCWVTVNPIDTALKLNRHILPYKRTRTMGQGGVDAVPASQKEKVVIFNVSKQTGRSHHLADFLGTTNIVPAFAAQ